MTGAQKMLEAYSCGDSGKQEARLIKAPAGGQNQAHGAGDGLSMVFHARPGVVVETIQRRLEERN